MNLNEKKLKLVQLILDTEKASILEKVEIVLKKAENEDWWSELGDEEKSLLMQGISEAEKGNLIPHSEVIGEARKRFKLD